jgi:hypothetical protein
VCGIFLFHVQTTACDRFSPPPRYAASKGIKRQRPLQLRKHGDFVDQTEGLILADLTAIGQLGRTEGLSFAAIGEAVRRYKVGIAEDPWARIDRDRIRNGAAFIHERVKGQDHAIVHVLDIVKRAVTGVGATARQPPARCRLPRRSDWCRQDRACQDIDQPAFRR